MRSKNSIWLAPFPVWIRPSKNLRQTRLIVLGCALLLLVPAIAFGDEPLKNVLIFNSEDLSRPGSVLANSAIRSTLKEQWKSPIQIYDEAQDSFRLPSEKYEAEMVKLLQRKYETVNFDLIFALGTPVLKFLLKQRGELFTATPIVFVVADHNRLAELNLGSNVTGVSGKNEVVPTLDLALTFHPQTQRVVVVAGNAPLDQARLARASQEFRAYEGRAAFTYLSGLTPEEVRQRLAVLPDETIVIFLSFNSDSSGKSYTGPEVVSLLAPSSNAPIYGQSDILFGHGIVGGRLQSFEALGLSAAQMGLRVLAGESARNIAPQTVPSVTMVDWRQLRRWGIDKTQIPAGSVVRYKEFSVWELYKWRIVGVVLLCILEALLIIGLLISRIRRRRAEEAKDKLAAIVESSDDAILSKTPEGIITSWNAGAEKMYGYTASEIVGQHVTTLAPAELKAEVAGILEQIQRGENVDHLETVRVTKDGRRIDVSLTISPIKNEDMFVIGASTIARDITARKKAEAEALEQRAELVHLSRVTMLGELSGSLAHELNQPLGAILRNTEAAELFLQEPAPDLDELRAILADIRKDDERAGAVIDRMRSLVKRREIAHSLLDLNVLASEVISLVRPDADSHKVRLALEPASSLPPVLGDRVQLQQVLLNLLLNAIHAVDDSSPDRRRVTVRVKPAGTQVEVAVSDTGDGIPTEKLARLFEPFFTTKQNGMGMGLPISRTIMKAHRGSIRAENDPAGGATFCFTLPVAGERSAS